MKLDDVLKNYKKKGNEKTETFYGKIIEDLADKNVKLAISLSKMEDKLEEAKADKGDSDKIEKLEKKFTAKDKECQTLHKQIMEMQGKLKKAEEQIKTKDSVIAKVEKKKDFVVLLRSNWMGHKKGEKVQVDRDTYLALMKAGAVVNKT